MNNEGECYPPRPSAYVDNTFLDLLNSSYPTQPHSFIAKYWYRQYTSILKQLLFSIYVNILLLWP